MLNEFILLFRKFLVAQILKSPPEMQVMQVGSLGWEDPLEKKMATQSSILAWKIPWTRGAWRATVHGVEKSQTGLILSSLYSTAHKYPLPTSYYKTVTCILNHELG